MEQKTIKDYSELELKAAAYDQIAISQNAQQILNSINDELRARNTQPVSEIPVEKEPVEADQESGE